ncbi:MAG TPA: hypothetical protein DEP05_04290 [Betaproteobacteria bacterium]|nr:hypothetical protein [Betaproteobacteria bacterium]
MTTQDEAVTAHPPVQVETLRVTDHRGLPAERVRKTLAVEFPAAGYWLCHEARILQEFPPAMPTAQFVSVDIDQRALVVEAPGYALSQLLNTPAGELQHPFQRSSDLIRLIQAVCRAAAAIHAAGVVHGCLRPDNIFLSLADDQRIDYGSVRLTDFAFAHSALHRMEKAPFLDPDGGQAAFLSPACRRALQQDWRNYARLCGEKDKMRWSALSAASKKRYADLRLARPAYNTIGWRADLYSLGYWLHHISLRRIDYFNGVHQEKLPALLKKMQRSWGAGGFRRLTAALAELDAFELDAASPQITMDPAQAPLENQAPFPALGITAPTAAEPAPSDSTAPRGGFSAAARRPLPLGATATAGIGRTLAAPRRFPWKKAVIAAAIIVYGAAWFAASHDETPKAAAPRAAAVSPPPAMAAAIPATLPEKPVKTPHAAARPAPPPPLDAAGRFRQALKAAQTGDATAQTTVGLMYRHGKGTPQNDGEAVKWYKKAALQGNAEAEAYLGFMYMTGRGVRRNDHMALKWDTKSADQGDSDAQYNLALMYLDGRGVPSDKIQAYVWFKLASANDAGARARLRTLITQMHTNDILEAERRVGQWRRGHPPAR